MIFIIREVHTVLSRSCIYIWYCGVLVLVCVFFLPFSLSNSFSCALIVHVHIYVPHNVPSQLSCTCTCIWFPPREKSHHSKFCLKPWHDQHNYWSNKSSTHIKCTCTCIILVLYISLLGAQTAVQGLHLLSLCTGTRFFTPPLLMNGYWYVF